MTDSVPRGQAPASAPREPEWYRAISELTTDYIFQVDFDPQGRPVMSRVTENYESLTGRRPEEAKTPEQWASFIHPEDLPRLHEAMKTIVDERRPIEIDCRSSTKGDQPRHIRIYGRPVFDPAGSGRVASILGAVKDITERKMARAALEESETLYRTTIDAIRDPLHVITPDMRIALINRPFLDLMKSLGFEGFLQGLTVFEAFPFLPPAVEEEYREVFATGRVVTTEEATRIGEAVVHTETTKLPILRDGRVEKVVTVIHDITERKRHEEELSAAIEKLKELDRLKALFLTTISHELRTPIATIQGVVETFQAGLLPGLSPDHERLFGILHRNVRRLDRLIANLLEHARLETQRFQVARVRVDLRDPVGQVFCDILSTPAHREVAFESFLPDRPLVAVADPDRVTQVALNLVDNALRFARSKVSVRLHEENGEAVLAVEDDGRGIAAADLPRLFERFWQGTDQAGGYHMGLGLAIVKAIVEAHGGKTSAENRTGGGARFTATFPLDRPAG